jgi:hypothetical protein
MMTTPGIPESWPLLLTKEQLCAYLGDLSWDTVKKIMPVAPLDLGANVLRYRRPDVDNWIARCPHKTPRLPQGDSVPHGDPPVETAEPGEERRVTSLDKVRRRTQQDQRRWPKAS